MNKPNLLARGSYEEEIHTNSHIYTYTYRKDSIKATGGKERRYVQKQDEKQLGHTN